MSKLTLVQLARLRSEIEEYIYKNTPLQELSFQILQYASEEKICTRGSTPTVAVSFNMNKFERLAYNVDFMLHQKALFPSPIVLPDTDDLVGIKHKDFIILICFKDTKRLKNFGQALLDFLNEKY